ncbi:MAG: hypothetical protein HOW73_14800 [Polyangiaceae bacterium]|nr:hypothetical protein [Polyangiaceae bacterium]
MLATSLGDAAARDAVEREASLAGLGGVLTDEETISLLKRIEAGGGPPGLAARLVRVRLERASSHSLSVGPQTNTTSTRRFDVREIVAMFSPALGVDKANLIVRNGLSAMNITGQTISMEEASALVEQLSRQGGIVATVARFVNARLLLQSTSRD